MNPTSGTSSGVPDLLQMLINISGAYAGIFLLIQAVFALIGVILFGQALWDLYALKNDNVPRRAGKSITGSGVIWRLITASVLTSLIYFIDISQNTLGTTATTGGLLDYQSAGLSPVQQASLTAIVGAFQLFGYFAFGKGWLLLDKHFNGGNGGVSAPITFMVAGVLLVYIDYWLPRIGQWVGVDFMSVLIF